MSIPNSAVSTGGTLALAAYNDVTKRTNLFSQTDLIWKNRLGGIDKTLLVGFEARWFGRAQPAA